MSAIQNLKLSIKKLGLRGTFRLLAEKRAKKEGLRALIKADSGSAALVPQQNISFETVHPELEDILVQRKLDPDLDPNETRPATLLPLLEPYPVERMERWPVSDRVNSVRADGADLLNPVEEPLAPSWTQPLLFDVA